MTLRLQSGIIAVFLALAAVPAARADNAGCWRELHARGLQEQLACLYDEDVDAPSSHELMQLLSNSDASSDHRIIAGLLERIRAGGELRRNTAEQLAGYLLHQHPIYQNRDRWHVIRLRAYLIATLTDLGFPDSGLPMLADSLIFVDERVAAVEVGAAIRAAGTLGDKGRPFLPYMLRMLRARFAEEEFSLARYETDFPAREATTVQLEVIRTAERIGRASDHELLATLRAISTSPDHAPLDPRVVAAARNALPGVEQRNAGATPADQALPPANVATTATPWRAPSERPKTHIFDTRFTDQDGINHSLAELMDRPVLLIFFYTRCQNAGKCSTAVSRLAQLQRGLHQSGNDQNIRLLAVTFEPAFDTPTRLKRFVQDRGLHLGEFAMTARVHESDHQAFIRQLDMPVSYSAGWVNTHGVEAVLLDPEGRLARKYAAHGWTTARVSDDIQRLGKVP